ncbi:hypothetical protein FHR75_004472 [Kineococcus radiotolerans]|uniref:Uncharacterized protein n=1 Tax=Kineococcus radiotolerans TaxID=131568 RepID=A0A7W4TR89_KINRA|nr:hypothetical protein [Kineococcus radiotolerans]MBB2903629.1 hypothetical protein [Kineococcus radiotolerans]
MHHELRITVLTQPSRSEADDHGVVATAGEVRSVHAEANATTPADVDADTDSDTDTDTDTDMASLTRLDLT